jgi:hypothetical protein
MLREAGGSRDSTKKSFKLQFENVYTSQSSFAGISFDRYLPTTIVVVSVLVTFNFFRSVLFPPLSCLSLASSEFVRSKMSAYFRGSNPHQADFMQQGICFSTVMFRFSEVGVIRQGASQARACEA